MVENRIPHIFCDTLKQARIAKGIEIHELANTLCLSIKHISQIEEGGDSAFFSKSHKVQVAKKVGTYLGLSEAQIVDLVELPVIVDTRAEDLSSTVDSVQPDHMTELEKIGNTNLETKSNKHLGLFVALGLIVIVTVTYHFLGASNDSAISAEQAKVAQAEVKLPEVKTAEIPVDTGVESLLNVCDLVPQNVPSFKVSKANSAGNFVYLVSRGKQAICVIDAKNNKQLIQLDALEKRNIIGLPPFTILSPDFKQLDVYYQGWKVPVASGANTIRTEEQLTKSDNFSIQDSANPDQK